MSRELPGCSSDEGSLWRRTKQEPLTKPTVVRGVVNFTDIAGYWGSTCTTRPSTELMRAASRTSSVLIASVAGTG